MRSFAWWESVKMFFFVLGFMSLIGLWFAGLFGTAILAGVIATHWNQVGEAGSVYQNYFAFGVVVGVIAWIVISVAVAAAIDEGVRAGRKRKTGGRR